MDNLVNLVKWFRPRKGGFRQTDAGFRQTDAGSLTLTSIFTNDAFWRVSADTKTCGSPLYLSPTGGLCLPAG